MTNKILGILAWLAATLFVVYSFCLNTAAAVFMQPIKAALHTNDMGVSLAVGVPFILGFACMQIPAGHLLDNYKTKYVVSAGVFVLALGNLLISFSSTVFLFALANFLQGIGASFAFIAAGVLISQWFAPKSFPILFGLTQTVSCILAGVLHYILMVALEHYGWNEVYQMLAGFGFAIFVLSLLFISSPTKLIAEKKLSFKQSLSIVCNSRQLWLCTIGAATSFGTILSYASFWYKQKEQFYAVSDVESVIISGLIFAGLGIGTPLLGWYSNWLKSRTMVLHLSLVLGTMALLTCIYLPHFNFNMLIIIKVISFLTGFLLSGSMLFYTTVNESAVEGTHGLALSVINTGVFLFGSLMMFFPYFWITVESKDFFTYLWVLPFSVLIAILLVYFIKESYK